MFLLVPDGYSRYGLLQDQQPARCFYTLTTLLKLFCCFLLYYTFALATSSHFQLSRCGAGDEDNTCELAPPFLRAACEKNEFHGFDECMRAAPWWLRNACVVSASSCPLFRADDSLLQAASSTLGSGAEVAYYTMAVIPMILAPVSLLLWLVSAPLLSCMVDWAKPHDGWQKLVEDRMARGFLPSFFTLGNLYFEFILIVLDQVSDINCAFVFLAVEDHPAAGLVQSGILILPLLFELIRSGSFQPIVIWRHFNESRKLGYPTAGFIRAVQDEKASQNRVFVSEILGRIRKQSHATTACQDFDPEL